MLEQLSEQVRKCYARAANARARADHTREPALKADYLEIEKSWLVLARSYNFTETLGRFMETEAAALRRKFDARWGAKPTTALIESAEASWLASIIEASEDAIVTKNLDGIIMSWNAGAERLFGYAAAEAVGRPITIVIPEDRFSEGSAILERIGRGERIDHFETVRRRKTGELIDISLTVSPVRNAEGRIIGASKIARDISEQKRIAALAREAEHRTNNILAIIQTTIRRSQADTVEEFKRLIGARIQALASIQELFTQSRWTGADLAIIAQRELAPYLGDAEARASLDGASLHLAPDLAQAVAMALHELATNAVKHGALSVAQGCVMVSWCRDPDDCLLLRWHESGGPPVAPPKRQGFGTELIEGVLRSLGGDIRRDWHPEGLLCEISLPV